MTELDGASTTPRPPVIAARGWLGSRRRATRSGQPASTARPSASSSPIPSAADSTFTRPATARSSCSAAASSCLPPPRERSRSSHSSRSTMSDSDACRAPSRLRSGSRSDSSAATRAPTLPRPSRCASMSMRAIRGAAGSPAMIPPVAVRPALFVAPSRSSSSSDCSSAAASGGSYQPNLRGSASPHESNESAAPAGSTRRISGSSNSRMARSSCSDQRR